MWHFLLMHTISLNDQSYPTDEAGYLKNLSDWSEALAEKIAEKEQIVLTPEHWEIIYLVRDFYEEYQTSPAIRMLVKAMAQKFGEEKGTSRYLQRLFPDGPAKQATKISWITQTCKMLIKLDRLFVAKFYRQ